MFAKHTTRSTEITSHRGDGPPGAAVSPPTLSTSQAGLARGRQAKGLGTGLRHGQAAPARAVAYTRESDRGVRRSRAVRASFSSRRAERSAATHRTGHPAAGAGGPTRDPPGGSAPGAIRTRLSSGLPRGATPPSSKRRAFFSKPSCGRLRSSMPRLTRRGASPGLRSLPLAPTWPGLSSTISRRWPRSKKASSNWGRERCSSKTTRAQSPRILEATTATAGAVPGRRTNREPRRRRVPGARPASLSRGERASLALAWRTGITEALRALGATGSTRDGRALFSDKTAKSA